MSDPLLPIKGDLVEVEPQSSPAPWKSRYEAISGVVDHVKHFRGKLLRPALLLLVARACGERAGRITCSVPSSR